jgi:hypothetical protein
MPNPAVQQFYQDGFTGQFRPIYQIIGANMNVTTDQPFVKLLSFSSAIIHTIICTNASLSLTTAAGGIYTAASKGGTAMVAAAQAYSALTSSALSLSLTIAVRNNTVDPPILSLTTGQGATATADFYIFGTVLAF